MASADSACPVARVAVATDRSPTADQAARWAAGFADRFGAELLLIQVMPPSEMAGTVAGDAQATTARKAAVHLEGLAGELAGDRGRARLVVDDDPAAAIVGAAEEAEADVLVVGNVGMSGRKQFLLGNVPNRVSHTASSVVVIVNTTTGRAEIATGGARRPRTAEDDEMVEPSLMGRAALVGRVMARHGLRELFTRSDGDDHVDRCRQARALRSALEELGPTFSKLGQALSTRPDLLPDEFIAELAKLQDDVPPLREAEVVAAMEGELLVPWEDVFDSIDPEPLAAGTIAQVHRATLTGGERVVVKVQRPTAQDQIMHDLGLLELFADRSANRPAIRQVLDIEAVFHHLADSLQRELDFTREAANIERMRQVLSSYPRLAVPEVHHALSTSRLLVMGEIQGVPIRDAPDGPERAEAAEQLIESYYRQVLSEGFFHADPHPGNLMWWDGVIYLLDLGMVGQIGPDMRERLVLLLMALWQEDVEFLADVIFSLADKTIDDQSDIHAFKGELDELVATYRHVKLEDLQLGAILQRMAEISVRYGVPLPASLTLTAKALAQMQFAAAALDPTIDPFEVASRLLMRNLFDQIRAKADHRNLYYQAHKLRARTTGILEAVERLIGAKPGPRPAIEFRAERLERTVRRASRYVALGLPASAAVLGTAIVGASDSVAAWLPWTFGALAAGLTLTLIVELLRKHP